MKLAELLAGGNLAEVSQLIHSQEFLFSPDVWQSQFTQSAVETLVKRSCNQSPSHLDGALSLLCLLRTASTQRPSTIGLMQRVLKETNPTQAEDTTDAHLAKYQPKVEEIDASVAPTKNACAEVMRGLLRAGRKNDASMLGRWVKPKEETTPVINIKRLAAHVASAAEESLRIAEDIVKSGTSPKLDLSVKREIAKSGVFEKLASLKEEERATQIETSLGTETFSRDEQRVLLLAAKEMVNNKDSLQDSGNLMDMNQLAARASDVDRELVEQYLDAKEDGNEELCQQLLTRLLL